MSDQSQAYPYAKAYLDQSLIENKLEKAYSEMILLLRVGEDNPILEITLKSPLIHISKKIEIVLAIFSTQLEERTMRFLKLILQKERSGLLFSIAMEFIRQYREYHNIIIVEVISPTILGKDIEEEILQVLKKQLPNKIELKKEVDPELIGGLILKIGDRQYDGSIRRSLREVKKGLLENSFLNQY